MVKIKKDYFSIGQICDSGQCFRLEKLVEKEVGGEEKERYALTALGKYLEIEQAADEISFFLYAGRI